MNADREELHWWVLHDELLPAPFRHLLFQIEEDYIVSESQAKEEALRLDDVMAEAIKRRDKKMWPDSAAWGGTPR